MDDEYSEQELQDACDVIAWLAAQPWCSGKVGMMGISWGGFNALQVAAKQPPALKAIITPVLDRRPLCRRHPLQGRLPADREFRLGLDHAVLFVAPAGSGAGRRQQMARHVADPAGARAVPGAALAEASAPRRLLEAWLGLRGLSPPSRRPCCRSAAGMTATATPSRISSSNIEAPVKGIVGPWIHKYPHFAAPEPRIGFLQEALRWWDRWLKGIDTGVESDPAYRAYLMDSVPPARWHAERPGRWIARTGLAVAGHHDAGDRARSPDRRASRPLVASPQICGLAGGEYFPFCLRPGTARRPAPRRRAVAVFRRSRCSTEPIDIVGAPEVLVRRLRGPAPGEHRGPAVRRASRRRLGADLLRRAQPDPPQLARISRGAGARRNRHRPGSCSTNAPIACRPATACALPFRTPIGR